MLIKKYQIAGMCCENCITHVKTALEALPQVADLKVQIESPQAIVSFTEGLPDQKILDTINNAGHYSATEITEVVVN